MDPRIPALARNLLDYSLSLKPGEKLLIEGETGSEELVRGLIAESYARGVQPFFELTDPTLRRAQLLGAVREQFDLEVAWRSPGSVRWTPASTSWPERTSRNSQMYPQGPCSSSVSP